MRYALLLLALGLVACDSAGTRNTGPTSVLYCLQDSTSSTGSKGASAQNGDVNQTCDKHQDSHNVAGSEPEAP